MKFVKVGGRYINLDKVTEIATTETTQGFVISFWLLGRHGVDTNISFKTKEEADKYIEKILNDLERREAYNEVSREGAR